MWKAVLGKGRVFLVTGLWDVPTNVRKIPGLKRFRIVSRRGNSIPFMKEGGERRWGQSPGVISQGLWNWCLLLRWPLHPPSELLTCSPSSYGLCCLPWRQLHQWLWLLNQSELTTPSSAAQHTQGHKLANLLEPQRAECCEGSTRGGDQIPFGLCFLSGMALRH